MFNYKALKKKCVAAVDGEMTIYSAAELKEKLVDILDDPRDLEINLSKVTEIDSAGVQLLMLAQKSRAANQHNLTLVEPSDTVHDTLQTMGLMPYFAAPADATQR